VGYY